MPYVIDVATNKPIFVPQERLSAELDAGTVRAIPGTELGVSTSSGETRAVPAEQIETARRAGMPLASEAAVEESRLEAKYGDRPVAAAAYGVARGFSGGVSDALAPAMGASKRELRQVARRNVGPSIVGEVGGAIVSPLNRIGGAVAGKVGGRAGRTLGLVADTGVGAVGSAVSELSLDERRVTAERAAAAVSSNFLFGGAIVAGGTVVGKIAEKGLVRSKRALDDHVARVARREAALADPLTADVAALDRKGLRGARAAETERIATEQAAKRPELAARLAEHHAAGSQHETWLLTQAAERGSETKKAGGLIRKAQRQLQSVTDTPKRLADDPARALFALEQEEEALERFLRGGDDIRAKVAADEADAAARRVAEPSVADEAAPAAPPPSARLAALDAVPARLERNRALQAEIKAATMKPSEFASPRLSAIADAEDALADAMAGGKSFGRRAAESAITKAAGGLAGFAIGGPMGAFIGAELGDAIKELAFDRLGRASAAAAKRTSAAIDSFLNVAKPVARGVPIAATRVLTSVSFGGKTEPIRIQAPTKDKLLAAYRAREAEIYSQTTLGPDGRIRMKPAARAQIADRLSPVRAGAPLLADRMETTAARRIEFLAEKLPKRPDVTATSIGPDRWRPSQMQMATFARYVAATEDPASVVERMVDGTLTPEDAEALRTVYPELFAEARQQIVERLPQLRATLPYSRRVMLSLLTGVPVDPAMHPLVLQTIQASFAAEPGTDGGVQPPKPQPAFGSVTKPQPTAAQSRQLIA